MPASAKISFASPETQQEGVWAALRFSDEAKPLAHFSPEQRARVEEISAAADFDASNESLLDTLAPYTGVSRLLVAGLGKSGEETSLDLIKAGAKIRAALAKSSAQTVRIDASNLSAEGAVYVAYGARLRAYRYEVHKTKGKLGLGPDQIEILHPDFAGMEASYAGWEARAFGVDLARDLVNAPGNLLNPETYVTEIQQHLPPLGVEVEVLDEAKMAELGFGALLGVGQGSRKASALVIMRWQGAADKNADPVAFVGKGVTFDTGGISIKPAAGMDSMTMDMGGSAAVVGAMAALAGRKAKVNAVGVVGLVENMPDGNAQRPGDIVTSYSGQTIQVLNTDAEGRLVLADALWYTQERFKPKIMIDLATLTGAILVALGMEKAGLFSNDDELADQLMAAGESTGDYVWRMPLGAEYNALIDSPKADVKNISDGRWGGSITAACFLERFVNGVKWAHLDIASTAETSKEKVMVGKGATGHGVRLLDCLVASHYEDK